MDGLVSNLDSFDLSERQAALEALGARVSTSPTSSGNVNMHMHSFFSYNSDGYSPSHLAWSCYESGLHAAGLCDFDVLDGLDEFLKAGTMLGLRATVNLETRAYFEEYGDYEINSPGEPGVTYVMGAGFTSVPAEGTSQSGMLDQLRQTTRDRNVALVDRINPQLREIAIRYDDDVVPLTPGGCPTERHIVRAYITRSEELLSTPTRVAQFWASILEIPTEDIETILRTPTLDEKLRTRLAKQGGLGYEQPTSQTYPPVDEFLEWVLACDAIPMITWLDGTSGKEADPRSICECMMAKGAAGLNIIPDRNWNLSGADRDTKRQNLREIVTIADELGLPLNIGTEMNKAGLPFVDDLRCEVLSEYRDTFIRGANIMVGHSILARFAEFPYAGARAASEFTDVTSKNAYFESVGALPPIDRAQAEQLLGLGREKAYEYLHDKAAACI